MAVVSTDTEVISRESLTLSVPYVAPDSELEIQIANSFAEILNLDCVGANDDFFGLGGDSLLAEVLSMRIRERTGHDFVLSSLVEYGSPRRIVELLSTTSSESIGPKAFRGGCSRPPVFVVHGTGGYTLPKPTFCQALAKGQRLRMFELPGLRGGPCHDGVEDIAAVYVAQLSEEYPRGPILIAAFCAGGLIALEMAAQLDKLGRPIRQLVLFDPPIRGGTLAIGSRSGKWQDQVKRMVRSLLPRSVLCAYQELKYRTVLLQRRRKGKLKYADLHLSLRAQAKLYVALLNYRPRPYLGPVTVLASLGFDRAFQKRKHVMRLLPQARIRLIKERHTGIAGNGSAARCMQAVFDAALGER